MAKSKTKKLRDHANELADKVAPHVETARTKAGPMLTEAREKAAPYMAEARDKAAPYMAEARDRTAPALSEAREKLTTEVLPVLTAAIAAANEATEDVREEAKRRGKATAAALRGDVEPPKSKHRIRKLLIVLGLGGIVAAVAKKMSDRQATTAWQSSYTPTPAPMGTEPTGAHRAAEADDEGGASPDVAAADAAAEPHTATTPDQPAEEIDVTKRD
jgi:hypothetical protein